MQYGKGVGVLLGRGEQKTKLKTGMDLGGDDNNITQNAANYLLTLFLSLSLYII